MNTPKITFKISSVLAARAFTMAAYAAEPLKVGLVLPMSGPFAAYGKQIEHGARLYLAQSGGMFSGRKVELIIKDDTGVAPEISKRAAQELVVKDKVDILAGFGLTPSAFAAAPVATEAKTPMIVMNAAASAITTKSEYILRVSHTLPQITAPIASWAAKNNIKKVYTMVADFGPGQDAQAQFKKTFTAAGGEVVGEVRTPVKNPDFAPFLQKIKDAKPEAVFLFVPPGEQTIAFMKGFAERDLAKAGIRIIATGDLTEEDVLDGVSDNALARTYIDATWKHIGTEETELLPLARQRLAPQDWAGIDAAFEANKDPWSGPAGEFRALFSRIVNMAPAPYGLGPA